MGPAELLPHRHGGRAPSSTGAGVRWGRKSSKGDAPQGGAAAGNGGDAERPPPSHAAPVLERWARLRAAATREGPGAPARSPPPRKLVSQRKLDVDKITGFFHPNKFAFRGKYLDSIFSPSRKQLEGNGRCRSSPALELLALAGGTPRHAGTEPPGSLPIPCHGAVRKPPHPSSFWVKKFPSGKSKRSAVVKWPSPGLSGLDQLLTPVHRDGTRCLHAGCCRDPHPPSTSGSLPPTPDLAGAGTWPWCSCCRRHAHRYLQRARTSHITVS